MKTGLLGIFGDYESAELARAILLVSAFPIERITLTAMQGPGQSRISPIPAARDKFLSSLRGLFKQDKDSSRAERLADRVERGAATVSAYAHNPAAAGRIATILKDCGATDVVQDTGSDQSSERTANHHEAPWPSYLWPAT